MLLFSVIFIFTKLPGYTNLLQSCFRYTMSQLQSYHQFQLPPIRFSATLQPTSLAGTVLSLIVVVWILCSQICCICRQVEGPSIIYCMHKEFEGRLLLRVQYFWLIVPLGLYFRSSFLEFISSYVGNMGGTRLLLFAATSESLVKCPCYLILSPGSLWFEIQEVLIASLFALFTINEYI